MNKIIFLVGFLLFFQPVFANGDLGYDFSDTNNVKIPLRITAPVTTKQKNKAYEGQKLEFVVAETVYYDNKRLIERGTKVQARLEIITTRGFAGIPAEIFITDFKIPNLKDENFIQPISKRGFGLTALILPIKWALTPFPPLGTLSNILVGFNATLSPKEVIYLTYYPER